MSLIQTAVLNDDQPFEYLVPLQSYQAPGRGKFPGVDALERCG